MYRNGSSHMLKICLLEEMRQENYKVFIKVILKKRMIHVMVETPIIKESGNRLKGI
jgi:hypothetical protein